MERLHNIKRHQRLKRKRRKYILKSIFIRKQKKHKSNDDSPLTLASIFSLSEPPPYEEEIWNPILKTLQANSSDYKIPDMSIIQTLLNDDYATAG
ncbi:hypothetical protein CJP46_30055 [Paenibacillus sp. XY044]|nr:hypothetical protein CJP46_30055 [Paenibacillus sp. XY044]